MDYKKEIEKLLNLLKENGIERDEIERDFEYGENYMDQLLSKGGNKKALAALRIYCRAVLPKSIPKESRVGSKSSPTINDAMVSLGSLSERLDKVLEHQINSRAEIRAYGQYQVSRDAQGDQGEIVKIMAQIGKLITANLGAVENRGSSAAMGRRSNKKS